MSTEYQGTSHPIGTAESRTDQWVVKGPQKKETHECQLQGAAVWQLQPFGNGMEGIFHLRRICRRTNSARPPCQRTIISWGAYYCVVIG